MPAPQLADPGAAGQEPLVTLVVALAEERLEPAEPVGGLARDLGRVHLEVLAEVPDPAGPLSCPQRATAPDLRLRGSRGDLRGGQETAARAQHRVPRVARVLRLGDGIRVRLRLAALMQQ